MYSSLHGFRIGLHCTWLQAYQDYQTVRLYSVPRSKKHLKPLTAQQYLMATLATDIPETTPAELLCHSHSIFGRTVSCLCEFVQYCNTFELGTNLFPFNNEGVFDSFTDSRFAWTNDSIGLFGWETFQVIDLNDTFRAVIKRVDSRKMVRDIHMKQTGNDDLY